jgi:hypothetical protein
VDLARADGESAPSDAPRRARPGNARRRRGQLPGESRGGARRREAGGIIGTFHHLYFTGTPEGVLALGATFSALEVVPLVLVGLEVWQNLRLARAKKWLDAYK